MKIIYLCFIVSFFISCTKKEDKLEKALQLAQNNRKELEKVLDHYSKQPSDSLKLQAACFLIENMPGHYTLEGDVINEYRKEIYADTTVSYFAKKSLEIALSEIPAIERVSLPVEDVRQITANFLICHIDRAMARLTTFPWLQDIPFDIFLEYLLPYRFAHERPDLWIDSLQITSQAWEELKASDITKYAAWNNMDNIELTRSKNSFPKAKIIEWFGQDLYDMCQYSTSRDNFKSRASALPAAIDIIPHFANRNDFHYWNTIISPEVRKISRRSRFESRTAKIFRKTYSCQQEIIPLEGEYIPDFFRKSFYKDISDEYMHTSDLIIPPITHVKETPRFSYLFVFNNMQWTPVAMGEFQKAGCQFEKLGKNIIYLPGYYNKRKKTSIHYPFILTLKGHVEYLIPDTTNKRQMRLIRKYPFNNILNTFNKQLEIVSVEASNHISFTKKDTVVSHLDVKQTYATAQIDTNKVYRYWRISIPKNVSYAEIVFFNPRGEPIQGYLTDTSYIAGFDNDPLTSIKAVHKRLPTIDFGFPVSLSKIVVLPRSDGNGIYPGNEYELFYHDLHDWQSIGRKVANNYYIDFENVPQGALYWLHNWTQGSEERIFTLTDDGDIRFW